MSQITTPKRRQRVPRVTLSIDEAAAALSLSPRTVEDLVRSGELPGFRVGRRWLFSLEVLRRWAAERTAAHQRGEGRP